MKIHSKTPKFLTVRSCSSTPSKDLFCSGEDPVLPLPLATLNVTGTRKCVMHLEHRATLGASLTGTFPALHKAFAKYSPAGDESQLNEESGVIIAKKSH